MDRVEILPEIKMNRPTRDQIFRENRTRIRQSRPVATKVVKQAEVTSDVYGGWKGRMFGAWIDADSRSNGYNEGALIENPAYMIESIWRDEFGLGSSDIDYASIDALGDSSSGSRKSWKTARSFNTIEKAEEMIARICYEHHMIAVKTSAGKRKLIALDSNPSTAYTIVQSQMSRRPVWGMSHHSLIRNKFDIGYFYNYATGAFEKSFYVDEEKDGFGSNQITNGDFAADVSGWSDYGTGTRSLSSNRMLIDTGAANDGVYQTLVISAVEGRRYTITFSVASKSGTWYLRLPKTASHSGTVIGGSAQYTITGDASQSYSFTATESADFYLMFYCTAGAEAMIVDNIVFRESLDKATFTPDEAATVLYYGNGASTSLCGVSQSRYLVENLMKEQFTSIYDGETARMSAKKFIEWRYAPHYLMEILGWWGDTSSSSQKPLISYERGDQCYVDHPLLDPGISNTILFMVTNKITYRNERMVKLNLVSMR